MSGENRTVLVSTRLGNPTGLTIDFSMAGRLYWCDSKENLIESMAADGSDRVVVVSAGMALYLVSRAFFNHYGVGSCINILIF